MQPTIERAPETVAKPIPRRAPPLVRRDPLLVVAGMTVLAGLVFWLVHDALTDDSYITLSYARQLGLHGQWGMVSGEFANSATSPLNVMLLAAGTVVLRSPILALGVVFVACAVVLALALRQAARESAIPGWTGVVGAVMILLNPLVLSTVGLEMPVAAALLSLLVLAVTRPRPVLLGVVGGLLTLTRLDLAIFVLVALLGRPALWRSSWKWLSVGAATTLPWFAFSWSVFGSAIPDTLVIKQLQRAWGDIGFANGYERYLVVHPYATVLVLSGATLGLVCLLLLCSLRAAHRAARLWPWTLLGIGGLAHYIAYTMMGVPPYHWYYAPLLIGMVFPVVACLGALATQPRMLQPAVVAGMALLLPLSWFALQQGVPWRDAPMANNWATATDYARVGPAVGEIVGEGTVAAPGEIGTLAYFCECRIMDGFSDRGYLGAEIEQRIDQAGPLTAALLRFNYRHFEPTEPEPLDYVLRREPGSGPDPFWTVSSATNPPWHLVVERVAPN